MSKIPHNCTSCGACIYLSSKTSTCTPSMVITPNGYKPKFDNIKDANFSCCPAMGIKYPRLYKAHYGLYPSSWLTGIVQKVRTGHAANPNVRLAGASGGVITRVLQYLLESKRVDAVIVAKQGIPVPLEASPVIATTPAEVLDCAGSVYINVPMLSVLSKLENGKCYAIVCTPEHAAALRELQRLGDEKAKLIKFVLGPYTGTALTPQALKYYLKSNHVKKDDAVTSVKWRAGTWPGYLEIKTESGIVLQSPKVYYNFLIPFFVSNTSLYSMDFCNEFADLAVGDAWSPKFENAGQGGVSVVVTRTQEMEAIIQELIQKDELTLNEEDPLKAGDMHGHMLDFKKRGGYLRIRRRRFFFMNAPDYGYKPEKIPFSRRIVELFISTCFCVCRTKLARWLVCFIPEKTLGPLFNKLRLSWKAMSRPTKRKGLTSYNVVITDGSDK